MPVPLNKPFLRNPRLYQPIGIREAVDIAKRTISPHCEARKVGSDCLISVCRDGKELVIGMGPTWEISIRCAREAFTPDPEIDSGTMA